MKLSRIVGLAWIIIFLVAGCSSSDTSKNSPDPKNPEAPSAINQLVLLRQKALQNDVIMLEGTADAIRDGGGYQSWTPTKLTEKLLSTVNIRERNANKDLEFEYVTDKPTHPWEIVLIPLDEEKIIRVEAYTDDIERPFFTKEIKVPMY